MALPQYIARITNLNSSAPVLDCPHENLEFSYTLNGSGSCSFAMPVRGEGVTFANLEPERHELHILRDGVEVWGGYVTSLAASSDTERVRLQAEGWFSRLNRRLISDDKIYIDTEQFDIAWDLISYTQAKPNGNMGITRWASETPSGVVRDASFRWWERRTIGEVLQDLAAMGSGFDFEITPSKVWKVYYPRKGGASGVTFALGQNVTNMYQEVDGRNLHTDVHAIGSGMERTTCIAVVSDATARSTYGLLEGAFDFRDIRKYANLEAKAVRLLNHLRRPRNQPQLATVTNAIPWGSYSVGDTATVQASYGFLSFSATYRIIAIVVHVASSGEEVITVHFDDRLATE